MVDINATMPLRQRDRKQMHRSAATATTMLMRMQLGKQVTGSFTFLRTHTIRSASRCRYHLLMKVYLVQVAEVGHVVTGRMVGGRFLCQHPKS